ncbi:protein NDR1-like [Abrus precatorius]|uniref:Protein NDR1-like n=1 Tax=Abrus precatorius TaxID=3816 RepID=A0A8B8KWB5_ABRPR|nr:protein NDR1-like [Abrus precatorius]
MAPESGNCCTCCLSSLITMAITAIFLWLTFRTNKPKCFIESLYVPSLHHHNKNDTLVFQLKLQNDNKDKGVKYDTVYLTFGLFLDNTTTRPLANATFDAFYQGHGKTAHKWASAVARGGGVNRTAATTNGTVFLRVDFTTRVKYKMLMVFFTKRYRLSGGANVEVNVSSGEKVEPKEIRLGDVPPRLVSEATGVQGRSAAFLGLFVTGWFLTAFT